MNIEQIIAELKRDNTLCVLKMMVEPDGIRFTFPGFWTYIHIRGYYISNGVCEMNCNDPIARKHNFSNLVRMQMPEWLRDAIDHTTNIPWEIERLRSIYNLVDGELRKKFPNLMKIPTFSSQIISLHTRWDSNSKKASRQFGPAWGASTKSCRG
jgi:hypothetical protein